MGLIIQNIEDGVVFTKEAPTAFNIASDFHYNNSEGKLTVPWFDYGALIEIKNNQKKCIRFSVIQSIESDELNSDEEVVEDESNIAEELNAPDIKKVRRRTFKRKRRRRFIFTAPSEEIIMMQDSQEATKDNSLFNFLREEKNSLKPYYLLSNNKFRINKPKQQKYIRAYLPTPVRKINPLEYENADYNHELEVMAYIESEEDPTEWKAKEQTPLQDSSFFIEAQALEIPSILQDPYEEDSIEKTNVTIEPTDGSEEEIIVSGSVEDAPIDLSEEEDKIDFELNELEFKDTKIEIDNMGLMNEHLQNKYLSELIQSLKNIIASKENEKILESPGLDVLIDDFSDTLTEESFQKHQEENLIETKSSLEEAKILSNPVTEEATKQSVEENYKEIELTSNIKTKTIYIPFSTYVDIDDFLHPALYGIGKQEGYNFLPTNKDLFPLLDTVFFDSMYFFQEDLYCQLIGYKVHEILFTVSNPNKKKLQLAENTLYKSQVKVRHNSDQKENKLPFAVHIKVPVIIGEYDVEISLKKSLDLEERIVNIKELSKNIKLTTCKFIPTSFQQSNEEGVQEATRGKLLLEGMITQRIEYTVLSDNEEKQRQKDLPAELPKVQQNAVIELVLQLLQVQKVFYPSPK